MILTGKDALFGVTLDAWRDVVECCQPNFDLAHDILAFLESLGGITEGFELLEALLDSVDVAHHFCL